MGSFQGKGLAYSPGSTSPGGDSMHSLDLETWSETLTSEETHTAPEKTSFLDQGEAGRMRCGHLEGTGII